MRVNRPRGSRRYLALPMAVAIAGFALSSAPALASASPHFRTLDHPGAGAASGQGTFTSAINNRGDVVGDWVDGNNDNFGFLFHDGRFTAINDPNAGTAPFQGTNPDRHHVGRRRCRVLRGQRQRLPRLHAAQRHFSALDDPHAGSAAGQGTIPQDRNGSGLIVGLMVDPTGHLHGFTMHNGEWSTVDDPKEGPALAPNGGTYLVTVNDHGVIAGGYHDKNMVNHAVLYRDGRFTELNDPSAGSAPGQGTIGFTINNNGTLVGYYLDSSGVSHGYVLRDGRWTTVDDPKGVSSNLQAINDHGTLLGTYNDAAGATHGFIVQPQG